MKLLNLYGRLGLVRSATQTDIKNAYYKLSTLHHPDKNDGCQAAAVKFREITEAYEILGNPRARREYDRESPFDGRTGTETKASRPKPQRNYQNASKYNDRDAEFEAKIRFNRQYWRQKANRAGSAYPQSKPYDFDAWFSAHYSNKFESEWYGDVHHKNDKKEYVNYEQTGSRTTSNKGNPIRPPQHARKSSPFDFVHIYTNPIEYTTRREKAEKFGEVANIAALIVLLCGFIFSVAVIIENSESGRNNVPKKVNSIIADSSRKS